MAQQGSGSSNEYARKVDAVERILGDPSIFPDDFKAWITRWLYGNVNFKVISNQLPTVEQPHIVGGVNEIALNGAWAITGGTDEPARYWKDYLGVVHLGGIVHNGVITTSIFTLPVGYRPQYKHVFAVVSNGAFGICTVNTDGTVVATAGSNVQFCLSGITFRQYS